MVDRVALTEALHRYTWALDENRHELLTEVFTEDAEFRLEVRNGASYGPFRGLSAIRDFFRSAQAAEQRRHAVSCTIVEDSSPTVKTFSLLTVFSIADVVKVVTTGTYEDAWDHENGHWRIKTRLLRLDCAF
jgi:hypothetical protein